MSDTKRNETDRPRRLELYEMKLHRGHSVTNRSLYTFAYESFMLALAQEKFVGAIEILKTLEHVFDGYALCDRKYDLAKRVEKQK